MNSDQEGVCVEAAKERSFSEVSKSWWQHEEWEKEVWRLPQRTVGSSKRERKRVYLVNVYSVEVFTTCSSAALLRAIRRTTCLRGATTNRGGATSGFFLPQYPPPVRQNRKPQSLLLTKASPARPFLTSAPAPPSFFQPQGTPAPPASLGPGPLRSKVASPPDPEPRGRSMGVPGPRPGSHHRGRWLGRKAEVAEVACPATPALLQKRSCSLRLDVRTVPSVFRAGEGRLRTFGPPRKFSR